MSQEILTTEEFAQRFKIGRSTLFEWIAKGVLVEGKHYKKIGRVLRFIWSDDILFSLETTKIQRNVKSQKQLKTSKNSHNHRQQSNIDWEY